MGEKLPIISFLKLQGRGAPITPWCWMGVDGMDLDRNKTQNIHIKVVLMRIKKKFELVFKLLEHGYFSSYFPTLMNMVILAMFHNTESGDRTG